jgi:hypothetical protein
MSYLSTYLPTTILFDMGRNLSNQNDQSNGPYYTSQKNHPRRLNMSKLTCPNDEWFFLCLFKSNIFLLDLLVRKTKFSSSFTSWKKLGCRPISVRNTEQRYNFGTKKFANRRMTCRTLGVFNWNWSDNRNVDRGSIETPWL